MRSVGAALKSTDTESDASFTVWVEQQQAKAA
jgi:hypothetical protein